MASIFGDNDSSNISGGNLNENLELPGDEDDGASTEQPAPVKVELKKRSVRNPRPRLSVETLSGRRGIQTIEEYFLDVKFKGNGYEKHDLDEILLRLQHWGHRMYPMYKFDDLLTNIQRLGKKKSLQVHMSRYRLGMLSNFLLEDAVNDEDNDDAIGEAVDDPFDEFDALLGKQIAISKLAPHTPSTNRRYSDVSSSECALNGTPVASSTFVTPSFTHDNAVMSTPYSKMLDTSDCELVQPLPPSQPGTPRPKLTAAQLERMKHNKRLAQERLHAKKNSQQF